MTPFQMLSPNESLVFRGMDLNQRSIWKFFASWRKGAVPYFISTLPVSLKSTGKRASRKYMDNVVPRDKTKEKKI